MNVINKRLDDSETIDALEREYGLPPGLVKKTAMEAAKKGASAPPPPPPVAPSPRPCRRRRRRSFLRGGQLHRLHPSRRRRPHRR